MLRVRLYSDVHTEFHADGGGAFIDSMDPEDVDVLVLAGDLSNEMGIQSTLEAFGKRFAGIPICYVTGNHEFYGGDRGTTWNKVAEAAAGTPNLHWLNNEVFEFRGRRFLGTTLWFYKSAMNGPVHLMNDFVMIGDFEKWVFEENRKAIQFLDKEVREGDIVITHYLPSEACVAPRYKGSSLNQFFVCDVTKLIETRKPALWFFGHTHDSIDVRIGPTRLVCNPFGYARYQENQKFDEKLIIEV